MAMTRKDFQALADGLKATCPQPEPDENEHAPRGTYMARANQWHQDVRIVADACRAANPQFDRDRFYAACGMVD